MAATSDNKTGGVPLSGDIKQLTAPLLFQSLSARSKTGTAIFEYVQDQTAENVIKKIYFSRGDITFASSNLQADRLGDRLLKAGKLTQAQLDASTNLIGRTGKKQGAILVELGFIKPQELVESVKEQVRGILQTLFAVRNGSYRFTEGPLPLADIVPLQMSTGNVILECVNAMPWDAVRKALPSPATVLRPATDPQNLFQDAQLSTDQRTVLAFIDGKRKIEEICSLSGVGDFNALRTIHLLLALRMAEIGALKAEDAEFARDAVRQASEAKRPSEPDLVVTREMVMETYPRIEMMTHYEALRIETTADLPAIKKAYFRMAKAYHPDRHFDPAMADVKDKLESLFHRIHQAYEVLSNPATREDYDRTSLVPPASQSTATASERHPGTNGENFKENAARANEWYQSGVKELKAGNYWGAVDSFGWATRLDPAKAQYFYYYGLSVSFIPRRKHEAEDYLRKALEIDPSKADYHLALGNLYLKSGLKAKALGVLNNAMSLFPDSPKVKEAIMAAGGRLGTAQDAKGGKKGGVFSKIFKGQK
jgi:tetratricopeptide (TPR) repeat protein